MTDGINISQGMRINRYLPIITLYFFLNSILLPLDSFIHIYTHSFFLFWLYPPKSIKKSMVFLFIFNSFCLYTLFPWS